MLSLQQAQAWYPADDPVHGFDHVRRVLHLAEQLAAAEGADLQIVRAAALLHDVIPPDRSRAVSRVEHQLSSAEFAAQVLADDGWPPERIAAVQHAIRAHRYRSQIEPPVTIEAQVLFDADKLDAIGAIGVVRAIQFALRGGMPVYAPVSRRFLADGQTEPGEPHSAYHEYRFKLVHIIDRLYTPSARSLAVERHKLMTLFFEGLHNEAIDLTVL